MRGAVAGTQQQRCQWTAFVIILMHPPKVWLITGASSGFGKALSEVVLREGDIVVATLRKPSVLAHLSKQYPPSQLLLLTLDVTRPSDISAAFACTQQVFGRLDVVFNNAGYAMFGEVEGTPDADARALLEVVFWGAVGICILQPGAFYTNVIAATQTFPVHPAYTECITAAVRDTFEAIPFDGDPYKFGEMLYRLVTRADNGKKIPLFLPVGEDALQILQGRLRKMNKVLVDAAPWSADLKKAQIKEKALTKVVLHRGDIVVATSANPPFSPLLLLPHKSSLLPSMLLFLSTSPPSSPGPKKSLGDLTSCSTRDVWRGQRRAL
ncbi:hypothetical protein L210DRAFT_1058177 [Boletus edulis BED1]|uniref:NAD(P)-binding protein n=1 Tax=Boletus edulis BED1 TaxID=1328754 RepID=A0AAD4BV75_BOLED|nr:hypothetical protein L210DRAFT_1058177 [Boletus edulis BED1]